jgi:hypothetical protein
LSWQGFTDIHTAKPCLNCFFKEKAMSDFFDDFGFEEACLLGGLIGLAEEEARDEAQRIALEQELIREQEKEFALDEDDF